MRNGCGVLVRIGAPDDDSCTMLGEAFCHAKANAAIAACHQCDLARQIK